MRVLLPAVTLSVLGALAGCSANGKLGSGAASGLGSSGAAAAAGTAGSSSAASAASNGSFVTAPSVTVAVLPQAVQAGQAATVTWTAKNAATCQASGAWNGSQPVSSASGVSTGILTATGTYTFGLTCSGPGGSGSGSQQVFVGAVSAPTVTLSVTPAAVQPGDAATLTWSATNSTSCVASGGTGSDGWSGTQAVQNTVGFNTGTIGSAGEYAYTLTCDGPGGSGTASQILQVTASAPAAPPVINFSVQPTLLTPGGSAALVWTTANSTACTASGGTGSDGWNGSKPLSSSGAAVGPITTAGTYTYTLTCSGAGGSNSRSADLVVSSNPTPPAVSVDMSVSPTTITAGQSAVLSWTSANASSCTASGSWGGTQSSTGSAVSTGTLSTPAVYSYTLTCTGAAGMSSSTATLIVNAGVATVTDFAANPINIQTGQSTSLIWASSGATACTASGGTGSDGWSGTVPVSSTATSVGPINTAGAYTYTLTCSGPGGTSVPASVTVIATAGSGPPLPAITAFAAAPTAIQVGQSTMLSWASINATACTASGGSGADSWSGTQLAASVATAIGPLNSVGTYTYTLTCGGPGGSSAASSVTVTVAAATPAASIATLVVTPATLQVGQSTTLTWTTANASSCQASGGTGSDGWAGATEPTSSAGTAVGPFTAAGTYTYTLTCVGPGGTSAPRSVNVTVNPAPPGAPVVSLTVNGSSSANIQPGHSLTFKWSATNATACTPSGGTGSDGWSGALAVSNSGLVIGPITVTGIYTYTLSCTGAGGTGGASVTVTVLPANSVSCGLSTPTQELLATAAAATGGVRGLCLLGCGVANLSNLTDSNVTNYATMDVAVGVAASAYIRVTDSTMTYPAGRQTGFLVADPTALLSVALLQNLSVRTLLNGTVQETATAGSLLTLQALGLLGNPHEGFVGFTTSKPFNAVEIDLGQLAAVLSSLDVYGSCVSLQ